MKINDAIHLPLQLPQEWPGNLCELPKATRDAIAEDRARSTIAVGWLQTMTRDQIERTLAKMEAKHVRDDMKRRLNQIIELKRHQKTKGARP